MSGPADAAPATLRREALAALCLADPAAKAAAARALAGRSGLPVGAHETIAPPAQPLPGRPDRPVLVPPRRLSQRPVQSREGRAALVHALAHIEFNAIDLALDLCWRFAGQPDAFYRDWLGVADDEARHFGLLRGHLQELGHDYGDFPAHDGLWTMARRTEDDLLARLALVPRTLEARGLDAAPPIRARLAQAGDACGAAILDVILHDEVGHVRIGNHWYHAECARRGLDPEMHADTLDAQYAAPVPRGPFNVDARRAAGFSDREIDALQRRAQQPQQNGPAPS